MATLNTLRTGSLIDAAFLTHSPASPRPAVRFAAHQEKAMADRLQQLQSALDEPPAKPTARPASAAPQLAPDGAVPARNATFPWQTLLACICSAAMGAGSTWLLMSPTENAPAAHQVAAIVPVPASVIAESSPPALAPRSESAIVAAPRVPSEIEIGDMVESWRQAWRDRDVATYLNIYGSGFRPADGSSRDAWAAARTKKLASNAAITLELRDLRIEQFGQDQYRVSFLQDYASGNYRESGRGKTLEVAREDGHWKIVRELQTP